VSVYLKDIPLAQARQRFIEALEAASLAGLLGKETVVLNETCLGRVLAEPVWARLSSPNYHASAMDGFAMRSKDTMGAAPGKPLTLRYGEQTLYIDTGDPLPEWADCVAPIETVEPLDANQQPAMNVRQPVSLRLRAAITPWAHVRPMGEDIVATQLVLPAGRVLRPVDLGALAASGQARLVLSRRPRVAILPTGTELVPVGSDPKHGEIIETNSLVLAAQINEWGGAAERFDITKDDFSLICQRVQQAADQYDLILLNAGSSAGAEDFSARVVESLGELLVHGVAVRPGHPVILGMVRRSEADENGREWTPIIGVPGYPVSAALTGEIFVEPLLARWLGRPAWQPVEVEAELTRKVTSPAGDDDYMRVVVGKVNGKTLAAPLQRGAGVITSLARADGIAILPAGTQGAEAGSKLHVRLYRPPAELEQTIFAIGSHDMTLDLVAQYLAQSGRRLVSANVGSQGGLVAIRRGEAHLAGTHLLDSQTGEYNLSAVQQYLSGIPGRLVTWVYRKQGLIVQKGNPKELHSIIDLTKPEVRFMNRQRGAGTRVLLDYTLSNLSIPPESILGYTEEEYTHLGVAAAVASGRADCGLGIAAAAQALELDFIPLADERYDLAIPQSSIQGGLLDPLFELMKNAQFKAEINQMPGYDVRDMGKLVVEWE
jgi:putative molybdopterin biosynthesis protein